MKQIQGWVKDGPHDRRITDILSNERGILVHKDFCPLITTVLGDPQILSKARAFLRSYNAVHVIHVITKSFFPVVTPTQIAECRYFYLHSI